MKLSSRQFSSIAFFTGLYSVQSFCFPPWNVEVVLSSTFPALYEEKIISITLKAISIFIFRYQKWKFIKFLESVSVTSWRNGCLSKNCSIKDKLWLRHTVEADSIESFNQFFLIYSWKIFSMFVGPRKTINLYLFDIRLAVVQLLPSHRLSKLIR